MDLQSSQGNTLVLVIVVIVAVLQTILLIGITFALAKICKSLDELTTDARAFLGAARRSIDRVEPRVIAISQIVQTQLQHADHMTIELLTRSKAHALAIDRLMVDFLRTAEHANQEIDHTTRSAFRELRALNAGVRAALGHLFSRGR